MQYHIMIKNLSKSYQSKGAAKTALSDVTLNIPQGEIFCIMGSSGSGKSTLLKILGGGHGKANLWHCLHQWS